MHGDFARTIDIPLGYEQAYASVRYDNGVLTIEIPCADYAAFWRSKGIVPPP